MKPCDWLDMVLVKDRMGGDHSATLVLVVVLKTEELSDVSIS